MLDFTLLTPLLLGPDRHMAHTYRHKQGEG